MLSPSLPFATEPKRAQESSRLFSLMFFGAMATALVSGALPFVYARPILSAVFFFPLLSVTFGMEMLLRRRVARTMAQLEFQ